MKRLAPLPSHVVRLRPIEARPYDWADESVSATDLRLVLAVCAVHDQAAVREAGRRLGVALGGLIREM